MFDPHKYDDKCGQIYSVLTASGAKQPPQVHAGGAQKNLSVTGHGKSDQESSRPTTRVGTQTNCCRGKVL